MEKTARNATTRLKIEGNARERPGSHLAGALEVLGGHEDPELQEVEQLLAEVEIENQWEINEKREKQCENHYENQWNTAKIHSDNIKTSKKNNGNCRKTMELEWISASAPPSKTLLRP